MSTWNMLWPWLLALTIIFSTAYLVAWVIFWAVITPAERKPFSPLRWTFQLALVLLVVTSWTIGLLKL